VVTDAVIIGASTPTVEAGTDLVHWSTFTNSPTRIKAVSSGIETAGGLIGWIYVVNIPAAVDCATAINDALNSTGVGISQATPVTANTDAAVYFVPLNGETIEKFSSTITNIAIAPVSIASPPVSGCQAYCQVTLLP
jgi:hypothetical protein